MQHNDGDDDDDDNYDDFLLCPKHLFRSDNDGDHVQHDNGKELMRLIEKVLRRYISSHTPSGIHFSSFHDDDDDDMMVTLRGWEAKMVGEGLLWGLRVVM